MMTRTIGSLKVSVAGLGCNNLGRIIDERQTEKVVGAAIDCGVTFFDTADLYGEGLSEEFLGRALGRHRNSVVIGTKFGMHPVPQELASEYGGKIPKPASAAWTVRACENSLKRLGTDVIDLFMLHQPDVDTPIEETLEALGGLVHAGKVREIGCSNFSIAQLSEAETVARELGGPGFVSVQNECSLIQRQDVPEFLRECERRKVAYLPFFPLASGLLTGKYRRDAEPPPGTRFSRATPERRAKYFNDSNFERIDRLSSWAGERGHTLHELALSWLASLPSVACVIPGATTAEQVRANCEATLAWRLTESERDQVAQILDGR